MTIANVAERLITQLGAEIVDLKQQRQFWYDGAKMLGDKCDFIERELAALKAQQPSAGVVLPDRMEKTETSSDEYDMCADTHNACLDEVARLNPCRAQSVSDGWVKGFKLHEIDKALDDGLPLPNYWVETCDGEPAVRTNLWRGLPGSASFYDSRFWPLYGADMIAAAPSAQQKESGDE